MSSKFSKMFASLQVEESAPRINLFNNIEVTHLVHGW